MITKRPWKLLPLAALFALGLFAFAGGLAPSGVRADVDELTFDPTDFASGEDTEGHVTFTATEAGAITIDVTDPGTADDIVLTLGDCDPVSCSDGSGADDTITISADVNDILFTLTAICDADTDIEVTVSQVDGGDDVQIVSCTSGTASGNVIITKEAPDDTDLEFDFTITGTGSSCEDTFPLMDGESFGFDCADGTFTVTEDIPSGWTLTAIDCTDIGITNSEIVEDLDEGSVTFPIAGADTIECTFVNEEGGDGGAPGVPATVDVSAAPTSVSCSAGSIAFISIVVKDANGNGVADGTAIALTTTLGTLSQTAVTTSGKTANNPASGGGATVLFTPPSNQGGTATITATSGGKSDTAAVTVTCQQATAVPPAPAPTATRVATSVVTPPSTGDGGLADGEGSSNWLATGIALAVTGTLLGGLALVRRRA